MWDFSPEKSHVEHLETRSHTSTPILRLGMLICNPEVMRNGFSEITEEASHQVTNVWPCQYIAMPFPGFGKGPGSRAVLTIPTKTFIDEYIYIFVYLLPWHITFINILVYACILIIS